MKGMIRRVFFVMAVLVLSLALTGGAWAALSVSPTTGTTYTDGVLTITGSGPYTITTNGQVTTDRIKVAKGTNTTITLQNVNIAPANNTGRAADRGKGRPFDMDGATVTLKVVGTNTLTAPKFSTAIFCPKGSKLTIEGTGILNANAGDGFCIAAIGGEGVLDEDAVNTCILMNGYLDDSERKDIATYEGDFNYRNWHKKDGVTPADGAECGEIIINSGTINAVAKTGDVDRENSRKEIVDIPTPPYWREEYVERRMPETLDPNMVIPDPNSWDPATQQYTSYLANGSGQWADNYAVVIGGCGGGPIRINGGTVNATGYVKTTGIGSVSNTFEGIYIKDATVNAKTGEGVFNPNAAMVDTGRDYSFGPAIGWASYNPQGDSSVVIEITGSAKVTAESGFGCAGIGGGRNGSGGYIHIGDSANVKSTGGFRAAGIGGGIAHSASPGPGGTGTILIDGSAVVNAKGNGEGAGIGGGTPRTENGGPDGYSGTIIIAGNSTVTATGGSTKSVGIGSGGADNGNTQPNASKVQSIIITTTGTVKATGTGSETNIGPALLAGNNPSASNRFVGSFVNLSNCLQEPKINVANSVTVDQSGNVLITGDVALDADTSQALANYLTKKPSATVQATDAKLTVTTPSGSGSYIQQLIADRATSGGSTLNVNGQTVQSYTVKVSSANTVAGSVAIDGASSATSKAFADQTLVTVVATITRSGDYTFDGWYENNQRVNTSQRYSFKISGKGRTLEARFTPVPTYNIITSSYPQGYGKAAGGQTGAKSGTVLTLNATPADSTKYVFKEWRKDNATTGAKISGTASFQYTVSGSANLYAIFEEKITGSGGGGSGQTAGAFYSVRVTSANLSIATVSGGGSSIKSGTQTTVSVNMIDPMYVFDGWYDGETRVSDQETYSFVVTKSVALTACFVRRSDPTTVLGHLKAGIESAADPERISSRVDKNGPNAVIFNDDGAIAAINSKKHDETTAEPYSVARGESIAIEVFYLNGSTEVLNTSISRTLTMEITSGGARVSALSAEMVNGYAVFEVPTSSLRASSAAEAISVREAERYVAKISDGVGDVMLIVPFMVEGHNDDSQTGGGSGGGGCSAGAAALVTIASLAMTKRRSR